jgi:hypothetical protein
MILPPITFSPSGAGFPYIREARHHTEQSITFDGHFYDAKNERMYPEYIVWRRKDKKSFHIEITEYIAGEDTSEYWTDDEENDGSKICLFPTEIITLRWRVIAELRDNEIDAVRAEILRKRMEHHRKLDEVNRARLKAYLTACENVPDDK